MFSSKATFERAACISDGSNLPPTLLRVLGPFVVCSEFVESPDTVADLVRLLLELDCPKRTPIVGDGGSKTLDERDEAGEEEDEEEEAEEDGEVNGEAEEKSRGSSSSNWTLISVSPSSMRAAARTMLLCLRSLKKSCVCFLRFGSIRGSLSGVSTSSLGLAKMTS